MTDTQQKNTHYIILTWGSAGDVYPFLSVATQLQQRGHQVTFLCPVVYQHYAQQAGVAVYPLGVKETIFSIVSNPDLWDSKRAFAVLWQSMQHGWEHVDTFIQTLDPSKAHKIIAHPLTLPMVDLLRTQLKQLQIIGAYLAPANLRSCYDPLTMGQMAIPRWMPIWLRRCLWRYIDRRWVDANTLPQYNQQRQAVGLPPVNSVIEQMHSVADLSVTLFPEWYASTQTDWPSPLIRGTFPLYDPNPNQALPDALQQFLAQGDAPIVFTSGTAHQHAGDYFALASQVTQQLGRRAILLSAHQGHIPDQLPDTIIWQKYVPLCQLLPHAAVFVHHGGIGTLAEALRAATPQLIISLAYDQFDNGVRINELGVGKVIREKALNADSLRNVLTHLLTTELIKQHCQQVAQHFTNQNSNQAIYQAIESL